MLDGIEQALAENDRVTLTDLGTFSVRESCRQIRAITGSDAGKMINARVRKYFAFKAIDSVMKRSCSRNILEVRPDRICRDLSMVNSRSGALCRKS